MGNGRFPGVRPLLLLSWGGNGGAAANSFPRWGLAVDAVVAVDAVTARIEITSPGRLKKLRVIRTTSPTAGTSVVYTVRVNGAPTAVTCTMGNGPTTAQDLVNSVAVVPGDVVEVTCAVGSGAPVNSPSTISLEQGV